MPIKQCDREVFSAMVFAAFSFVFVGIFSLATAVVLFML